MSIIYYNIIQIIKCFFFFCNFKNNPYDETDDVQKYKYERCKIFITLTTRIEYMKKFHLNESIKTIIINDFETLSNKIRNDIRHAAFNQKFCEKQLILTSGHFVKELKDIFKMIPNAVVSTSSYFDLYCLGLHRPKIPFTIVKIFEASSNVELKLKSLICMLKNKKTIIICQDDITVDDLSESLKVKFKLNCMVNKRK